MYKVTRIGEKFAVVETNTEQVIRMCNSHEDAHKLYRQLKGGKGFIGNTPPFFLTQFKEIKRE